MVKVLNDYLVHSCWGLHLGYRFLQKWKLLEGSWAPLSCFLFRLWLIYYALVFVCLMQSLTYMLWMKKWSMSLSLESESGVDM